MDHLLPDEVDSTEPVDKVHVNYLIGGDQMSIQHFEMEAGAVIPEHNHPHEQIGFIYDGAVTLYTEDTERTVKAGEGFFLPGGEVHSVENASDETARGVDIFSPPRAEDFWSE